MYREELLELYKHPLNYGELKNPTITNEGVNPLCGDEVKIFIKTRNNEIESASFTGKGCVISIASASLITEKIKGMKTNEVMKMNKDDVLKLLKIKLSPSRLKCALLPLKTLQEGIKCLK